MLKLAAFFISFLLNLLIFLKTPKENVGLSSFAPKIDVFGSPSSTERFINIFLAVGIFIYLSIAFTLNLIS